MGGQYCAKTQTETTFNETKPEKDTQEGATQNHTSALKEAKVSHLAAAGGPGAAHLES